MDQKNQLQTVRIDGDTRREDGTKRINLDFLKKVNTGEFNRQEH